MKTLKQHIAEAFRNVADRLDEHAISRSKIIDKASDYDNQILCHLAKIWIDFDKNDENKHIGDVSGWIRTIETLRHKTKMSPINMSELFLSGYTEEKTLKLDVDDIIWIVTNKLSKKYDKTKLSTLDSSFVIILEKFAKQLDVINCKDVSQIQTLIKQYFVK